MAVSDAAVWLPYPIPTPNPSVPTLPSHQTRPIPGLTPFLTRPVLPPYPHRIQRAWPEGSTPATAFTATGSSAVCAPTSPCFCSSFPVLLLTPTGPRILHSWLVLLRSAWMPPLPPPSSCSPYWCPALFLPLCSTLCCPLGASHHFLSGRGPSHLAVEKPVWTFLLATL